MEVFGHTCGGGIKEKNWSTGGFCLDVGDVCRMRQRKGWGEYKIMLLRRFKQSSLQRNGKD